jgi:hypothetical protein
MSSNTLQADINEILLGYYVLGGNWTGFQHRADSKKQLNSRKKQVGEKLYQVQSARAEVMSEETLKWAKKNGYKGKVKRAWWTARPGILSKAVGYDVDSRKNPTDTLLEFADGQFLGVSAKSTKGKGDIGFKNPGVGTVEKSLKINLKKFIDLEESKFTKRYSLSESKKKRKAEIRKNPKIEQQSNLARDALLKKIRDVLFKKLNSMSQKQIKEYILSEWMDVGSEVLPPYIKVTGHGNKAPFTASILDPLKDSKSNAVQKKRITLKKVGNDSVGILAGGKQILKMRAKYESQAMASSLKFSGDPWA